MKIRMQITKDKEIRFVSHLDYLRAIERSIRRAELPVAYSNGFNPHMKLSLASALGVGIVSYAEFMEMEMAVPVEIDFAKEKLSQALPRGIRILAADFVANNETPLMAQAAFAKYQITLCGNGKDFTEAINKFNEAKNVIYKKPAPKRKEKFKEVDLKNFVDKIETKINQDKIICNFEVKIFTEGSVKAIDVINSFGLEYKNANIERLAIFRQGHLPMLNETK